MNTEHTEETQSKLDDSLTSLAAGLKDEVSEQETEIVEDEDSEIVATVDEDTAIDEPEAEGDTPEYIVLDDSDMSQMFKMGDSEPVSMKEYIDAYNNRDQTHADVIARDRQEIEEQRAKIKELQERHEYAAKYDEPHEMVPELFGRMYKDGLIDAELHDDVINSFNKAIQEQRYNPDIVKQQAALKREKREIEDGRNGLLQKQYESEAKAEFAKIESRHGGKLSAADQALISEQLTSHYNKTGQALPLSDIYDSLRSSGKILIAPPKSKTKLKDQMRRGPIAANNSGNTKKSSRSSLLKNLAQSLQE